MIKVIEVRRCFHCDDRITVSHRDVGRSIDIHGVFHSDDGAHPDYIQSCRNCGLMVCAWCLDEYHVECRPMASPTIVFDGGEEGMERW